MVIKLAIFLQDNINDYLFYTISRYHGILQLITCIFHTNNYQQDCIMKLIWRSKRSKKERTARRLYKILAILAKRCPSDIFITTMLNDPEIIKKCRIHNYQDLLDCLRHLNRQGYIELRDHYGHECHRLLRITDQGRYYVKDHTPWWHFWGSP